MREELSSMFDPVALAIVLVGTLLATVARSGLGDVKTAARAMFRIGTNGFDVCENRMALAPSIEEINRRGPLCTDIPLPPDASLARVVIAYARSGSIKMLHHTRDCERKGREAAVERSVQTFEYAGELAPVFGLVGTLFAITQLAPMAGDGPVDIAMASIATAVLSSLYGVLVAHLVCIPIARAIERRAIREEEAREELIAWLQNNLSGRPRSASSARTSNNLEHAA